jgi:hypothetical protein
MNSLYLDIIPSKSKAKKYDAVYYFNNKKIMEISFGAKNYIDFTIGATVKQRNNYLRRHKDREDWTTPFSAGSLSRWILWNTNDINNNIEIFRKKFNLR